jgi:hypothetical protein
MFCIKSQAENSREKSMMANSSINRMGIARANSTTPCERPARCQCRFPFPERENPGAFIPILLTRQPGGDIVADFLENVAQVCGTGLIVQAIAKFSGILE